MLLDEENQPWFKKAHVGKYLGHAHINTSLEGLNSEESRPRSALEHHTVLREDGLDLNVSNARRTFSYLSTV